MPNSIDSSAVRPRADARRAAAVLIVLAAIMVLAVLLAAMLGPYPLMPDEVVVAIGRRLLGEAQAGPIDTVLFQIRLPRVMAALLVGAALAAAGASYQTLFRNPLVSPDILGASSGAAFGAVVGPAFRTIIAHQFAASGPATVFLTE